MPKTMKGMNKHQKAAFRMGEKRVSKAEIEYYIELSRSDDPADRHEAASNLCPCHVRRRIDAVWDALYRMLEDPDDRVRRAAYHTLEDGGRPDDPKLMAIFERAWETETDKGVRAFLKEFMGEFGKRQAFEQQVNYAAPKYPKRGKCDFCGETNAAVRDDFNTEIPEARGKRLGLVCEKCDR